MQTGWDWNVGDGNKVGGIETFFFCGTGLMLWGNHMIIFSIGVVHPGQKALDSFIVFVQTLKDCEPPELFHGIF